MKQNKIPRNEYIRKPVGKANPYKEDTIYTDMGQWKYPGQVTKIPSGDITMQGVPYPVYGEDNLGNSQMMYPGMDYQFPGQYVTEYPQIARNGGGLLNKTLTCPKCGWSWKAVDGGTDIATCHKCGGTAKLAYGGLHKAQKGEQVEDNDSWLENIAEIIDPTGISSWDDIYRAYKNSGVSKELALESLGAIPFLGKVSKVTKPGIHLTKYSGIDQILKNTLPRNKSLSRSANVASKTGRGTDAVQAVLGAKDNSGFTWDMRHGEVPKYNGRNIFPQIDLGEHGDFAYGGDPSLANIEGHYPFGGIHTKTHTHMKKGGWLDKYQTRGEVKPYKAKSQEDYDYRKKMYNDSLALHNYSDFQAANELDQKSVLDHIVDIGFGFLPVHKGERDYSQRVFNYAKNLVKNNPRIKIGLPGVGQKLYTEEDYKKEGSTDVYHDTIKPASLWMGDAVNAFYKKPVQQILPYTEEVIIKPSMTKDKSGRPIGIIGQTSKNKDRHLMTGKDWQDVNSNDYGAEEAKIRSADPEKFDIYRLPNNKFELVPKTKKQAQIVKPKEVITPDYLPMIQTGMPDIISREPEIIAPPTPRPSSTNNRISWRMDPETRKMVPVYLEGKTQKVKEGKRLYNKYIPSSTAAIPADFVPQFEPDENKDVVSKKMGGWLDKMQEGGTDQDVAVKEQIENNKNFLKEMVMSPLFEERWAKMTGKDPNQGIYHDKETNPSDYQGWMLDNLNTVKHRTKPKSLVKENSEGMYTDDGHKILQGKEYNSATDLHELSHASTRGKLKFNEPYTYSPGIGYNSLYGEDYKEVKNSPFKGFKTHKDYVEDYYGKEDKRDYFKEPTEIKARVDVGRRLLQKEGSYDPIKSRFEEKDYNNLKKYFKEDSNIKELLMNYSKDDVIRMMNDIVSNQSNESQPVAEEGGEYDEYRRGGMVNPLMKSRSKRSGTSKNIQSSINKIFLRNSDIFGPGGKNIYNPKSKYQDGGWLDQYQDAGQLRAASSTGATPVSTQAPINPTNATNLDWVAKKWKNRDQGPSDWNFAMMDKSGSYVDSGIDPFTLMLTAPQQVIKTATSAAKNLGNVVKESPIVKNKTTEFIKETVNQFKKAHKWSKENIQDIKDLSGQYKTAIENITSKEGLKRLKDMGVEDTDDFVKYLNNIKLNATMEGSHFFPVGPGAVSINPAQIKKLKETMVPLGSQKSAIDHELGHAMQYYLENKGKTFNRLTDLDIEAAESLAPHMTEGVSDFFKNTRGMDYESAKDIAKNLGESSGNYLFRNKREPLAHLRETKRAMMDKGVISNIHEKITPEHIKEFILKGGDKDRILSFLQQTPEARQTLSGLLNKTPALIPIGLGVGAAANQKKMGGWLDKYNNF